MSAADVTEGMRYEGVYVLTGPELRRHVAKESWPLRLELRKLHDQLRHRATRAALGEGEDRARALPGATAGDLSSARGSSPSPSPSDLDPGPTVYEQALLSTPSAQALVARLDAATDTGFADRGRHVRQVALAVLVARGEA